MGKDLRPIHDSNGRVGTIPKLILPAEGVDEFLINRCPSTSVTYRRGHKSEKVLTYLGASTRCLYLLDGSDYLNSVLYQVDTLVPITLRSDRHGYLSHEDYKEWLGMPEFDQIEAIRDEAEWRFVSAILNDVRSEDLYQTLHLCYSDFDWPKKAYVFTKDGTHMLVDQAGYTHGARYWVDTYRSSLRIGGNQ